MIKYYTLIFFHIFTIITMAQSTPLDKAPTWAKNAIWYQIFVERFYNGDKNNEPKPENMDAPPIHVATPKDWQLTPWTHNWYAQEDWAKNTGKSFNEMSQYRRFGGDLQGVLDKLDYLEDLGINALYLNPINDAPSLHKYDARYYHHVDIHFGPDPEGDRKLILAENPNDPATWQWTAADKLFLRLIEEAHKRKMKIIMDYSWNHTGTMFWAWQDILKNQANSAYKDWYEILTFNNPETEKDEFSYKGWLNFNSLPEIKKVNITTERKIGHPYEGDINEGAKKHIFAVTKRWLAPNGDTSKGIDGFRLDVADHIGLGFWRDFRKYVRAIQPEAYLVGEIWWEEWPDKLMNPVPYTQGDVFDAVMFYQVYRPARYFFAENDYEIDAQKFKEELEFQWNRLDKDKRYAMMNVNSSHDAPRLLTDFYNPNKYKFQANKNDNPAYKTGKPDAETYKRLKLYLIHAFTNIGAPHIWNGEEMGMWGEDDPHCRKPLWWKEFSFSIETNAHKKGGDKVGFNTDLFNFYKKLIAIRKENPILATGDIEFLEAKEKQLIYKRYENGEEIIVGFNLSKEIIYIPLAETGKYLDLLTHKTVKANHIAIKPLGAVILRTPK